MQPDICPEPEPNVPVWKRRLARAARWLVWAGLLALIPSIAAAFVVGGYAWMTVGALLAVAGGAAAAASRPAAEAGNAPKLAFVTALLYVVFGALWMPGDRHHTRPQAKLAKSLNNIRQLAVAVQVYAQDNDEAFPGWENDGTKASPRYVHNVWDQQIASRVRSLDVFSNGDAGIRSPSQPGPKRDRVLTYGLNGALIGGWSDGWTDLDAVDKANPPRPLRRFEVTDPAATILFAELDTERPMDGVYGQPIPPEQRPKSGGTDWAGTTEYERAQPGWIDIDPRAFCDLTTPPANSYQEPFNGATGRGVGRDLYGRGACYAFCDGHVQFMRLAETVGIGEKMNGKRVTADNCWSAFNPHNMWNPKR